MYISLFHSIDLTLFDFSCSIYQITLKNIGEKLNILENETTECWNKFRDNKSCIWVSTAKIVCTM